MTKVCHLLSNGSLIDKSGNGNDGTLTAGTGGFKKTERGQAMLFDGADTKIDTGSDFIGTSACTIRAWIKARSYGETADGRILDNGKTYLRIKDTNNNLRFTSDDSNAANSANNSIQLSLWYRVAVTRTSAGVANLYINGVLSGTADQDSGTPVAGSTNVIVGNNNAASETFDGFIQDVEVDNIVLTAQEIAKDYNDTKGNYGITQTKRNFQYPDPNNLSNENGLIAAYNMKTTHGEVIDISGNGNNGTITGPVDAKGVFGRALSFDGVANAFDTGSEFIGTSAVSISAWIYAEGWGQSAKGRIVDNKKTVFFIDQTGNLLKFASDGATIATSATSSIQLNTWYHVVVTRTADGTANIYIDGVLSGDANQDSGTPISGTQNVFIGNKGDTGGAFDGTIDEVLTYNRILTAEEIKALYNKGARQVLFKEDFSDEGTDGTAKVPREWTLSTGSVKMGELSSDDSVLTHLNKGTKYLECVSGGIVNIPSNQAYGTWEFDMYKGDDANSILFQFIATESGIWTGGSNVVYAAQFNNLEGVELRDLTAPVSSGRLFATANSYIAINTWYRIRVTRTTAGVFTMYIKGGAFGNNWTLVDVTGGTGTNPITDTTTTTSNFTSIDFDSGDRVANIVFKRGIEQ